MKQLFKIALNKKLYILLASCFLAMCAVTIASQMEMLALGILAKKGPDAFELFGPVDNGQLERAKVLTKEDVDARLVQMDSGNKGYITKEDTETFLAETQKKSLISSAMAYVYNKLFASGNIWHLALLIFAIAIFKALTLFTHRFIARTIANKASRNLRQAYFEHLQSLPMSFYQQHNIGSLSSRVVVDAFVIASTINSYVINYMQTPFTLISTLILCFATSWQLTLVIFFGFPLIILPIAFIAARVKRVSKQLQTNQENFSAVLIDFLSGIQTVKVFAMEEFSLKKYKEHNNRMTKLEQRNARYEATARPLLHTVAMFFLAAALLCGLYVWQMDISEVFFFCGLLLIFYEPIKKFAEENHQIQRGEAATERMLEVMSIRPHIEDSPDAKTLDTLHNSIEFDDVWFKYENEWILKGISFTVQKGQTVAIVGPTGAGKSTIVQLLPRLYDVQKGDIKINGISVKDFTQRSLRDNIAFVPQKPFLFLDTIAENIAFGRPFTRQEIEDAARLAHAVEFIKQLPEGYDTPLAENGKNLSGGQQQRLAIARALVKKAPILIMDEATSSLDSISEQHIKEALGELHGKMTQIIIAHRFSTIEHADKIIYIEKGEKVAEGTKEQLLASCQGFRHMWDIMYATAAAP